MGPLLFLYVLSGASGLTFEILWARQLGTVLGATTQAIATVIAVFMAGLALGGVVGARLAGRVERPMRVYGAVELAIAAVSVGVCHLLPALEALPALPARYGVSLLALLVPSALMGLTFPLVVEAFGRRSGGRPAGSGMLYGLNTVGAALGCLAAGYLGIGFLGLRDTGLVAAGLNLVCGIGGLLLASEWGAQGRPSGGARDETALPTAPGRTAARS